MLPASNRGVGMNFGFPDVCLTPTPVGPVPIPYPNIAMNAQASVFSPIVKVSGVHALNLGSMIAMTSGDEAGTAHWTVKGPGKYIMGNPIVFVDKMPAISLTCPTMGNTGNNALGAVVVPSAVNVFYTYAQSPAAASPDNVSATRAAALGDAILGRAGAAPLTAAMLDDGIGYVRVAVVTTDITSRFHVAARKLEAEGARALVLDLAGCPGGDLDAVVAWAAMFLDAGAEIVRIEDAEGDELVRRAELPAAYTMPLVVLVDGGTGSAAEIVAAALKSNGRALVLGQRTHGKGSAQRLVPGEENSFAYRTAAFCTGPDGAPIDGVGVEPDLALEGDFGPAWLAAACDAARARLS
ncbi:S41 family peptidase [Polyangium sp. y55x31]|uniref:S41 family peptidase n=1 Tax=Polyangium sp. y55x31 TaxID=3042688 RepID=UPI002482FEED|nr:S41 family peptidase [Polyangium sp. y55x31]MDI1480867.1 S41 family peptidase [Polyangium sp. y55x31]